MLKRLILLFVLITLSSSVFAQRFNKQQSSYGARDNRFEAAFLLTYTNSTSVTADGGSSLDIDSSAGWGITLGWNWTDKFNTSYKLTLSKPGYSATIVPAIGEPQTIDYDLDKISHQLNATYFFRDKPFTPFIQAGAGITTLDSNIPEGPPTTGCWWDPWWGYVCTTTWSSYKSTKFSYNAGLGLRWDVNNMFFMHGAYNKEWVSTDSGSLSFDTMTLAGGLIF